MSLRSSALLVVCSPLVTLGAEEATEPSPTAAPPAAVPSSAPPQPAAVETPASDGVLRIRDLRLDVGLRTSSTSVTWSHRAGTASSRASGDYSDSADHNPLTSAELTYTCGEADRSGGLVYGGGLAMTRGDLHFSPDPFGDGRDRHATYSAWAVLVRIGYAYPLSDWAHVEVAPFAGVGRASSEWFDGDFGATVSARGHGRYWEAGIEGVLEGRFHERGLLGLRLGYVTSASRFSVDYPDGSHDDVKLRSSGVLAGIVLGYCF